MRYGEVEKGELKTRKKAHYVYVSSVKMARITSEKSIIHIAVADNSILTYVWLFIIYCCITTYPQTLQLKITNIYCLIMCVVQNS